MRNEIKLLRETKETVSVDPVTYTEFYDLSGNEFIYEDGVLKDILIGKKHIHIFHEGDIEIDDVSVEANGNCVVVRV